MLVLSFGHIQLAHFHLTSPLQLVLLGHLHVFFNDYLLEKPPQSQFDNDRST